MSIQVRQELISKLVFQSFSQSLDLLNPDVTNTYLVEGLHHIVNNGWILEITAVRSDHHDDSMLGKWCHFNGYAVDCWPLKSNHAGDYYDAGDPEFSKFLSQLPNVPGIKQVGLAGSAALSSFLAQSLYFQDDGADHVHIGIGD